MRKQVDALRNSGKKIILYGAGSAGRQLCDYLEENFKLQITCFCDSDSSRVHKNFNKKSICSLDEIKEQYSDSVIIITVYDKSIIEIIRDNIIESGYKGGILSFYDICSGNDSVEVYRDICANIHKEEMDTYFERAEAVENINIFWKSNSMFYKMFQRLDLTNVVELACGKGRHVPYYLDRSEHITLVDILNKNIESCKKRFGDSKKITYYKNSGYDLKKLKDSEYTALFTYDSMVHFESIDIYHYLAETNRILKTGGMALFHHSNNHSDYKASFVNGINGRNYMSTELFAHFADRSGLEIIEQKTIDWGVEDLDALTLVAKR